MEFYAYSVDMVANMSQALQLQAASGGDTGGAAFYGSQYTYFTNVANAIRTNFFFRKSDFSIVLDQTGSVTNIGNGSQADFGLALFFNMIPETQRVSCVQCMLTNVHTGITNYNDAYTEMGPDRNHLSGGIQASGREMLELSRDGHTDKAYELLLNLRFPSWLYAVTNGTPGIFQETTTSERWNSYVSGPGSGHGYSGQGGGNSFNHYAFGSVGEWVWRTVAGINPDGSNPAYKNVVISPQMGGGLTYVSGTFNSIHGLIASSWTTNNSTNSFTVTVPANATATLYIPGTNLARITESGLPATNAPGVLALPITNGSSLFQLGSGVYNFTNWP